MKQKTLERWLKIIIMGMGICGLALYGWFFPCLGRWLAGISGIGLGAYRFWLILLWVTGIPCYAVLCVAWRVSGRIGAGRAFSPENAVGFRRIAGLAAADTVIFGGGNLIYLLIGLSHPTVLIAALMVVFLGIAVAVCALALASLIANAADLQEQSDWTI